MPFHSCYECAETSELNLFQGIHVYNTICFRQTCDSINPSKFDERLFSDIYLCRLRLKQGREIHDFIFWGWDFQRDAPANDMLVLNKPSLGLTLKYDQDKAVASFEFAQRFFLLYEVRVYDILQKFDGICRGRSLI